MPLDDRILLIHAGYFFSTFSRPFRTDPQLMPLEQKREIFSRIVESIRFADNPSE